MPHTVNVRQGRPSLSGAGRTKPTSVSLGPGERAFLQKLARAENRSLSGMIRYLVREALFGAGEVGNG